MNEFFNWNENSGIIRNIPALGLGLNLFYWIILLIILFYWTHLNGLY
jgi:hypothetical protein